MWFEVFRIFYSLDMGHENVSHLNERWVSACFGTILSVFMLLQVNTVTSLLRGWRAEHNVGELALFISVDTVSPKH